MSAIFMGGSLASSGRWCARELDRDIRRRKADFSGAECLDKAAQRQALQVGRAYRCRGKFTAHDQRGLPYIDHSLHLQRLDEFGADLRIVEQLLADALYGLAHRLDVGRGIEVQV